MKDKIMKEFSFDQVKKHMNKVGWGWAGIGIPSLNDMVETVGKMFDDLTENGSIATGGFVLTRHDDSYELHFAIESAYAEKV